MAATAHLLSIPAEIRLMIYKLLLSDHDGKKLSIRTETSLVYEHRKLEQRRRSKFIHMSDRLRARSVESTYCLLENPGIFSSILGTNRQIHAEATDVLYSEHIFDFNLDIESLIPFLQDLTPTARSSIKHVSIVKRALPYTKDFDRCEWQSACTFVSRNLTLARLDLGVLGGAPRPTWGMAMVQDFIETYDKSDFHLITKFEGMEWANQLAAISGLQVLNVKALLEHCPPPQSNAMAFFVKFSASIEKGFTDYMTSLMVMQVP